MAAGACASAGVSVCPDGSRAAVVVAGAVVPVRRPPSSDVEGLLAGVVRTATAAAGPGALRAVTVDVSAMLLDAVMGARTALRQVAGVRIAPRPAGDPDLSRSP